MDCTVELLLKPFQSTLLQEERRRVRLSLHRCWNISIHAPTRGATKQVTNYYSKTVISIHAPTRGATLLRKSQRMTFPYFNPRSYKRSDSCRMYFSWSDYYFNPRSYKRSDDEIIRNQFIEDISIHAPTRGATFSCWDFVVRAKISIHAPTRGATSCYCVRINCLLFQSTLLQEERQFRCNSLASVLNFNPRSYKRSDFAEKLLLPWKSFISIHAPTRGATQFLEGLTIQTLFQSTLLQEERRLLLFLLITFHVFQSTLLQEERQWFNGQCYLRQYFNPRSYKRSDRGVKHTQLVRKISIHAPTRGATSTTARQFIV